MKKIITILFIIGIWIKGYAQLGFQEHIISSTFDNSETFVSNTDFDGDGDQDIITRSTTGMTVYWYENSDGQGNFTARQQIMTSDLYNIGDIHIADINGDGNLDILAIAVVDFWNLYWFENLGNNQTFSNKQLITSVGFAHNIDTADIDNDGDLDIIYNGQEDTLLGVLKNLDGQGNFGAVDGIIDGVNTVNITDIDGDGNIDILYSRERHQAGFPTERETGWYGNTNGQGDYNTARNVINDGTYSDIYIADIDGDSDKDILVSRYTNDTQWYDNLDGSGTFDLNANVINYSGTFSQTNLVDVDNDGDVDLLNINTNANTLVWFENDGLGNFDMNTQHVIVTGNVSSFTIADINNDGKQDVVVVSYDDNTVAWYENLGRLYNEINGNISLDIDNNGCSADDADVSNFLIVTESSTNSFATFSQDDGSYTISVNEGDFTTTIVTAIPTYYTANPTASTNTLSGIGNSATVNFCLEPVNTINDLNISIYPSINEPRPGFDTTYTIVYKNEGTTQLSGTVVFEYDTAKLQFLSASETVNAQTSNTLSFSYTALNPFETKTIDLMFNVYAPPTTNIGEILNTTATINPVSGDNTQEDNSYTLQQTLIGSYDPNDIQVLEGDQVLLENADKYVHYVIRFQNTGTASAINVRVQNVLDANLDWTTMQLESLSHLGRVQITDGNMIEFVFDNINLPDSTTDEPNSHGYITYKIKPKNTVVIGDIIANTADIFFDFNLPITTNTVTTQIVETLSVSESVADVFSIYPNPTKNTIYIQGKENISKLAIRDLNGRLLKETTLPNPQQTTEISMENTANGMYFLSIETAKGTYTQKIIKK